MKDNQTTLWNGDYSREYEQANYGSNLAGLVMCRSHQLLEKPFGPNVHFSQVLEVGAGTGIHLKHIRHTFDQYWLTDANEKMLANMRDIDKHFEKIKTRMEDATELNFKDETFDRVIATHVLEHLLRPHQVLEEWSRVLRPGGILSIVLPCDPGLLWRLGRRLGPRKRAKANGLAYDYIMAREHINPITNLVALINHHFAEVEESWWPTRIPFSDVNLIYTANVKK